MNKLKHSSTIKRLAIIPARSGSKRIPNKNIRMFCGKPMIQYILETAFSSALFDKVHVSTDSIEIKEIVNKAGFQVDFLRPKELSGDNIGLIPVIQYVFEKYNSLGIEFDEVWMLMACNPLLKKENLIEAAKQFSSIKSPLNPLIAIKEFAVPIQWAYQIDPKTNILEPLQKEFLSIRSQDLNTYYHDAGSFEIYRASLLRRSSKEILHSSYIGFLINKNNALDIDDLEDWKLAESMYKNN